MKPLQNGLLRCLLAVVVLVGGPALVMVASVGSASANASSGFTVKAGPHKGSSHSTFFGATFMDGHWVYCSDPIMRYATVGLHVSDAKLPHLIKGGSAVVKTLLNGHAASANTARERAALQLAIYSQSTDSRYRKDIGFYRHRLPGGVVSLSDRWLSRAERVHGPFKASTLTFAKTRTKVGETNVAHGTLTATKGHPANGLKPKVKCTGATVSKVSHTDSNGKYTFNSTRKKGYRKTVTCHARFTLPSWTRSRTGVSRGHQHQSTGHFKVHVTAKGSYGFGVGTFVTFAEACTTSCGTTVPIDVVTKKKCGSADLKAELVEKSTGSVLATTTFTDVGCGASVKHRVLVRNGDSKVVYLRWFNVRNGTRISTVTKGGSREIICPPAPSVVFTVTCTCSHGSSTVKVISRAVAKRVYRAVFTYNGKVVGSGTLVNGVAKVHSFPVTLRGDELGVRVSSTVSGTVHTWNNGVLIK